MLKTAKTLAREKFLNKRKNLSASYIKKASEKILKNFEKYLAQFDKATTIIGAYWPVGSEFDTKKLLQKLSDHGFQCALPRLIGDAMEFRKWQPGSILEKHKSSKIFEPLIDAQLVVPSIVITPLVACDKEGNRLGYGKGYYDRYLSERRLNKSEPTPVTAVALCYAVQISSTPLPHEPHDQKLDVVISDIC